LIAPRTTGSCAAAVVEELASGFIEMSVAERPSGLRRVIRVAKMRGTPVEPVEFEVRLVARNGLVA
jgi:KaiC/GvpD/RAD55 family RecA-like ATPase